MRLFGGGNAGAGTPNNMDAGPLGETGSASDDPPQRRWSLTVLFVVSVVFTVCVAVAAPTWDTYTRLIAREDAFGIAAIGGGVIVAALLVVLMFPSTSSE